MSKLLHKVVEQSDGGCFLNHVGPVRIPNGYPNKLTDDAHLPRSNAVLSPSSFRVNPPTLGGVPTALKQATIANGPPQTFPALSPSSSSLSSGVRTDFLLTTELNPTRTSSPSMPSSRQSSDVIPNIPSNGTMHLSSTAHSSSILSPPSSLVVLSPPSTSTNEAEELNIPGEAQPASPSPSTNQNSSKKSPDGDDLRVDPVSPESPSEEDRRNSADVSLDVETPRSDGAERKDATGRSRSVELRTESYSGNRDEDDVVRSSELGRDRVDACDPPLNSDPIVENSVPVGSGVCTPDRSPLPPFPDALLPPSCSVQGRTQFTSASPSLKKASASPSTFSPFGGFLAKLKDAIPSRFSSNLSKSSRLQKSTTALILQDRQPGLPSKNPEEEARHREMYDTLVEEVKKKEKKEAKKSLERLKNQLKMEDLTSSALKVWKRDLLPYWDDVKNNYYTRQLWWHGIPPSIRGVVWKLVVGNDLNITKELYDICLLRFQDLLKTSSVSASPSTPASPSTSATIIDTAIKTSQLTTKHKHSNSSSSPAQQSTDVQAKECPVSRESSVELIRLDVSRTFPSLCIFQKVGPYHEYLEGLLGAYVCYRPDVGYVQGMSFVAAILLLNMEVHDAFICFANLLNRPIFIAFFRLDADMMKVYFNTYNFFFKANLPKLYRHFCEQKLTADLYIIDWVFSLYSKCFNLDIVSRIWDIFFRDGEQFLFRTALGILKLFQPVLANMDFIQMAQFLVRPPESQVDQAELFQSIECIDMECKGMIFKQVLEQFKINQLSNEN